MRFTTINPQTAGLAADVGETVMYVNAGGVPRVATLLFKYGATDLEWCTLPFHGGAEPVTADPRIAGLDRTVGSRVLYVTGGAGTALLKYGAAALDWCTWDPAVAAHVHNASDLTSGTVPVARMPWANPTETSMLLMGG